MNQICDEQNDNLLDEQFISKKRNLLHPHTFGLHCSFTGLNAEKGLIVSELSVWFMSYPLFIFF